MKEKKRSWSETPLFNKIGFILFTIVLITATVYFNY